MKTFQTFIDIQHLQPGVMLPSSLNRHFFRVYYIFFVLTCTILRTIRQKFF